MWCRSAHTTLRWATSGIVKQRSTCRQVRAISNAAVEPSTQDTEPYLKYRRLSSFWLPTGGVTAAKDGKQDDTTALLIRSGFIRQAHSGIYHYLPLAEMLEQSLEQKLSWHLKAILGASKLSLSALSDEDLWRRSGRIGEKPLADVEHQFLTVNDRKDSRLILSPTHEEEITTLVANHSKSYKDFPLRLFQIGRKYRDELRPRHGLLRTKEFIMKDLYTFDTSEEAALKTYNEVREMYRLFFRRLGVPVVEASASSGDMGGNLSHEFHILSPSGEDTLFICESCGFAENEEVTSKLASVPINEHSCPQCSKQTMSGHNAIEIGHTFHLGTRYSEPLNAVVEVPNTKAPEPARDVPSLDVPTMTAVEGVGLGEEPSSSSTENIKPVNLGSQRVPLQMGCHGIGLSRLIGATASMYADGKGLRWPLNFFPINIMIVVDGDGSSIPNFNNVLHNMVEPLSRLIRNEHGGFFKSSVWLDDRQKSLGWKLKDAELVGYPITVVLSRNFIEEGTFEFKCRFDPELSTTSKWFTEPVAKIFNALELESETRDSSRPMWRFKTKPEPNIKAQRIIRKHLSDVPLGARRKAGEMDERTHQIVQQDAPSQPQDQPSSRQVSPLRKFGASSVRKFPTRRGAVNPKSKPYAENSWLPHQATDTKTSSSATQADSIRQGSPKRTQPEPPKAAGAEKALTREHLLEKVQLLERLFAMQDMEREIEAKKQK